LVEAAEVVVGGERHLAMAPEGAERIAWPSPWNAMETRLGALRGRRVAVLVTGDPVWFSGGVTVARAFPGEAVIHPHPGAFTHAAARMLWRVEECECLSVHGRPLERVVPHLAPGGRLLLLAHGSGTAAELARLLVARGWGASRIAALSHMGGSEERRVEATAEDWAGETPALVTLAVDCVPGPGATVLPRTGLPDDAFQSDGTMTKREVRAATLAKLVPRPGALLWDVGLGSGSVAVEWMRAAKGARAVGVETRADRRAMAAANALALGVPELEIVAGEAPGALEGLPAPDAVFLGGGLSEAAFGVAWARLRPGGRLVANAVTLEGEAVMLALHARHGGELVRIAVSRAEPVGRLHGWRPAMAVMQWSLGKPW
jgi:precorrin-6Y C5,15-methyltransferase (decarboxylating)